MMKLVLKNFITIGVLCALLATIEGNVSAQEAGADVLALVGGQLVDGTGSSAVVDSVVPGHRTKKKYEE